MRRTKILVGIDDDVRIEIAIRVKTSSGISVGEIDRIIATLTDASMKNIYEAPLCNIPLHRIDVR